MAAFNCLQKLLGVGFRLCQLAGRRGLQAGTFDFQTKWPLVILFPRKVGLLEILPKLEVEIDSNYRYLLETNAGFASPKGQVNAKVLKQSRTKTILRGRSPKAEV